MSLRWSVQAGFAGLVQWVFGGRSEQASPGRCDAGSSSVREGPTYCRYT